jgi:uridylate kinase
MIDLHLFFISFLIGVGGVVFLNEILDMVLKMKERKIIIKRLLVMIGVGVICGVGSLYGRKNLAEGDKLEVITQNTLKIMVSIMGGMTMSRLLRKKEKHKIN